MKNKAIFLDRDGTLMRDMGYLKDPSQIDLIVNIPELLFELKKRGYLLIVISNQSGVARGYFGTDIVVEINDRLNSLLYNRYGVKIDAFYFCPHHPDFGGECSCRKPKPGMVLQAAEEFNIDLKRSIMVGDKESDHILLPELHFIKVKRDCDWSEEFLKFMEEEIDCY